MKKHNLLIASSLLLSMTFLQTADAQIDRSTMPTVKPLPQINLGTPVEFELKNGLKVLVVENHKLPRVSASLTLDNPPYFEGDKAGKLALAGDLFGSGTQSRSKDEFNQRVDFLGASVRFSGAGASMNSLSKYFDEVLGLMAEAVLEPKFTQEEFDKSKDQLLEGLKSDEKSVSSVAGRVQDALTYGTDHVYGEYISAETVENVVLADVESYYNKNFKPNNAYLVIVGDVKAKSVKKLVKSLFSKWESGTLESFDYPTVKNAKTTEINLIDMPNAVQSELAITSTFDLKRNDDDYFALLVANEILGGGFNSYINMNLREAHGWTYGARSAVRPDKYIGRFKASTSVRNAVTDSAVVETMKEIQRIKTELVDENDLKNIKAKYSGNFVMALEKPSIIARYALRIKTDDLPTDYYKTYLQKIDAVTIEDVKRVANKYFHNENMRIIVTGKGEEVLKGLERLGYPMNYYDAYANPTEKPVYNKPIPAGVTTESIVNHYVEAIGGADKCANAKTIETVYEAKMGPNVLTISESKMAPNMSKNSVAMGSMVMQRSAFDGKTGYQEAQGQKKEMTAEEIAEAQASDEPLNLKDYRSGKLVKIESLDSGDAYVVETEENTFVYFNIESGLLVQSKVSQEGPQGVQEAITLFNNYQAYDGIKFPSEIVIIGMGPGPLSLKAKSITVNSKLSAKDFN